MAIIMSLLRLQAAPQALAAAKGLTKQNNTQLQQLIRTFSTTGTKSSSAHGPSSLQIVPSRYQWHKYKDGFHFYFFLGVIPLSAIVFYANVFIGPATLTEIPECYNPKQWEYYRLPITRWFSQHVAPNMQEQYERNMHYLTILDQKRKMRLLAWKVERLMRDRGDYPNYYTNKTIYSKYVRGNKIERDYIQTTTGDF